jgi:hypothetical protein
MSFLGNLGIGGRLRLAFGGLFLALVLVGGLGLYQAARLNDAANDLAYNRLPSVTVLGHLAEATSRFREAQAAAILVTDSANTDSANTGSAAQSRTGALADVVAAWKEYQPLIDPGEEQSQLAPDIDTAWKSYQAQDARLVALMAGTDKDAAARFFTNDLWPYAVKLWRPICATTSGRALNRRRRPMPVSPRRSGPLEWEPPSPRCSP